MMDRKGQAAMEFLMTYGWAILAAIIAIGVVAVVVTNTTGGASTADRPIVSAPFYGNNYQISTTQVVLEFRNDGSESVTVNSVSLTDTPSGACDDTASPSSVLAAGATASYTITCNSTMSAGDNVNADITIGYTRGSSTIESFSTGTLSGTVRA